MALGVFLVLLFKRFFYDITMWRPVHLAPRANSPFLPTSLRHCLIHFERYSLTQKPKQYYAAFEPNWRREILIVHSSKLRQKCPVF